MNLIDVLDMYALIHDSDDLTLMLQDYTLDNRINRDNFNRIIIKELGNMRPYVTDTTVFKFALEEFFDKWNYNIGKLIDTMYYDYEPINNVDTTRTLNESTDRDMSEAESKDKDETESRRKVEDEDVVGNEQEHRESTADIDNTDTYTTNVDGSESRSSTDTETVSAYDSSTYQPSKQTTSSMSDTTSNDTAHSGTTTSDITSDVDTNKDTTESTDKTTTESNTKGTTEDNTKNTEEDIKHHLGEKLNGKTADHTYQELVQQERDLAEFNIFNWILKRMREELFLLVY